MEFQDKVLTCIDCGADFVFTAGEQLFFHDKQFRNEPKRCKTCKSKRVAVLTAPQTRATRTILARRNPRYLLTMRQRNHRPFPPNAGAADFLPRMFHAEEKRSHRLTVHLLDGGAQPAASSNRNVEVCPQSPSLALR